MSFDHHCLLPLLDHSRFPLLLPQIDINIHGSIEQHFSVFTPMTRHYSHTLLNRVSKCGRKCNMNLQLLNEQSAIITRPMVW